MKLESWPPEFEDALPVLEKIEEHGYEAYFVGGSVRDLLLGLPIHDVDIATSAYPEEIKAIFPKTIDTGIQHGTVTVRHFGTSYEVTTFRTESGYQDFRRPNEVKFVRSLKQDLERRDFTINALAVSTDKEVVDEFNGIDDLDNKIIRAVGDAETRFHEDALRMMRAVRFQAQLKFQLEDKTSQAIQENAALLSKISVERINSEFIKMMMARDWQTGLNSFINLDLYQYSPKLVDKKDKLSKLLKYKSGRISTAAVAWSLIIDALQLKNNQITPFLKDWKESNKVIDSVHKILGLCRATTDKQYRRWDIYQYTYDVIPEFLNFVDISMKDLDITTIEELVETSPIKNKQELAISGRELLQELNLKSGPQIGKYLSVIEKLVVNGEIKNDKRVIIEYLKNNDLEG